MPAKKAKPVKTATKKTKSVKASAKKTEPVKKSPALKGALTKTQLLSHIAEEVNITKQQVGAVLQSLSDVIERHIKKRAVGEFKLSGLLKIKTIRKPAVKARKGINPFTKEETMFKAKPARIVVKILALKGLKEMVE